MTILKKINRLIDPDYSLRLFFNLIKSIIGKKIYLLIIIAFMATIVESIAITMILPILSKLSSNNINFVEDLNLNNNFFNQVFEFFILYNLNYILIILLLIILLRAILLILANGYRVFLKFNLLENIKKRLIKNYFNTNFEKKIEKDSGYYNNLITEQSMQFTKGFDVFLRVAMKIIQAFIFIIISLSLSFYLNIAIIFFGLLLIYLFRFFNKYISNYSERFTKEATNLSSLITQAIQSYEYLKLTNQEKKLNKKSYQAVKNTSKYLRNMGILNLTITHSIEPIIFFVLVIFYVFGANIFNIQEYTILLSFMFLFRGLSHLVGIQQKILGFLSFIGSVREINNELERNIQISNYNTKNLVFNNSFELKNIYFRYPNNNEDLLKNITLKIEKNTFTGIVGQSGSGKSTLIKLMSMILSPKSGEIFIDDKKIDANKDYPNWRENIGYISQKLYLYKDSILNNIIMDFSNTKKNEIDMNKIQLLINKLNLKDFINNLPNKYDQIVGEMGENFSMGQIQRLILVRELYRDPKLLIFDEPTSALDTNNKKSFIDLLNSLKNNYTIIIISHDKSIIESADKVYEINKGLLKQVH